jgi:hypothetical protein
MDNSIIATLHDGSNPMLVLTLLSLACFRVWLEIMGFDFKRLPLTQKLFRSRDDEAIKRFHRSGLYFSLGYLIVVGLPIVLQG